MTRRVLVVIGVFPLLLFAASCAMRAFPEDPPARERRWPAREQVYRHTVRAAFSGGTSLSFDGIMRFKAGERGPEIRVVCLGAFGLTLCDMTVTPEERRTDVLHPGLARIPHVEEHIALCVRSVWFASLPVAMEDGAGLLREVYGNALLEHSSGRGHGRVVRAAGPEVFWTVAYVPADPQPDLVTFHNDRENYTIDIRLVSARSEGGTQP